MTCTLFDVFEHFCLAESCLWCVYSWCNCWVGWSSPGCCGPPPLQGTPPRGQTPPTQGARRTNIHQNKRDKIICQKYICIIKQQMFHRIKCFVFSILFIKFLEPVYRLLPITFVQEIALCWAYSSKTKLMCNIDCYNRYKSAFCRLSNIQRHRN